MAEAMDSQPAKPKSASGTKPLTYSEKQWLNVKRKLPKNRIRWRNEQIRKMLTPKNSVMALNELLKDDGIENAYFQVDTCLKPNQPPMYRALVTTRTIGYTIIGYADTKSKAKQNAAEKALKIIYVERLRKVTKIEREWMAKKEKLQKEWEERQKEREQKEKDGIPLDAEEVDTESAEKDTSEKNEIDQERLTLPMVQLASFALYKLYTSWEDQGCVVPNFNSAAVGRNLSSQGNKKEKPKVKKAPKRRRLPLNASSLHPGFLLYYMCPGIEYKDVAIDGPKAQQTFVVSVETEGKTFMGRANSKRDARRLAAVAACEELFQVKFEPNSSSNQPVWSEDDGNDGANPVKRAKMPEPKV